MQETLYISVWLKILPSLTIFFCDGQTHTKEKLGVRFFPFNMYITYNIG